LQFFPKELNSTSIHIKTIDESLFWLRQFSRLFSARPGVHFTNMFTRSFYKRISQKHKRQSSQQCLIALLGSASRKAAHKMLVILTTVVRFTNILQPAFALVFICQRITKLNCNKRKAAQNTLKKAYLKMLLRLTPVVSFTNIL